MNKPIKHLIVNAMKRSLDRMFGGGYYAPPTNRNHWNDFSYPAQITFDDYYKTYSRNGIASGLVDKTAGKTWETTPWLMEFQPDARPHEVNEATGRKAAIGETKLEATIRRRFEKIRFWQSLKECDRMSMVGNYAGAILRYNDGLRMDQPVVPMANGLEALHEVLPVWQGQLRVNQWHEDQQSTLYGTPKMFEFNEAAIPGDTQGKARSFQVHPDRVVIFSSDGTVHGKAMLEPSYNALLDLEKISGAGGEGFYKNAAQRLAFESEIPSDGGPSLLDDAIRDQYGGDEEAALDALADMVRSFSRGDEPALLANGMKVKPVSVTLAQPKEFFEISLQMAAAPFGMPTKELVGNQTGDMASKEDATEWAKSCMSRRYDRVLPASYAVIDRLQDHGVLPVRDWFIDWASLIDASPDQKLERAERMAKINQTNAMFGAAFAASEIREEAGREPDMPDNVADDGFDENDADDGGD